ncbi:peptidoglycan-binding domain-containing protein [Floridanema evergladense]|uniref:Peptidoglycan-binding protein n=1 Tax=Floridaenema evergladense BLCC-F167 TaxID=3153639 RepID=A0ABV4WSJ7_9CYAN
MQSSNISILRRGSKGQTVKYLQELLKSAGYSVAIDGIFGPATEAAVKKFQKDRGLVVDGIVGPKTWSYLEPAC